MLKIERIEICGFKSFSDRTSVEFRDGITAVVGPNGCGKSNIGDALNWVLGEQSPKTLRGRQMADIIFSGSDARKPTSLAEVALHLKSLNGDAGREITITRRLFRSGESEYLIDGQRARLKDIQELLRNERVGAKTYATIEQGRIDQIINAKPTEIRLILEEAAGIAGFKHKRRLTQLKLEATEANLLRVSDIITEVKRQINSLKRQASKARRYQRVREELRLKQKIRFGLRARRMDQELSRLRAADGEAQAGEAAAAARLGTLDAELAAARQALEELERTNRERAETAHRLEIAVDRDENEIRVCRERIDEARRAAGRFEDEASKLEGRREELGERSRVHERTAAEGERELARVLERLAAKQEELDRADTELRELRESLDQLRGRSFEAMSRLAEERNRKRVLEESIARNSAGRERLERELAAATAELDGLRSESDGLDRQLRELADGVARLERDCPAIEARLAEARDRHAALVEAQTAAREREQSSAARLGTLQDVSTRFAGVSDGVRALLTKGAAAGIRTGGVVADYVEAGREVEGAAEVYLQGLLPTVILEDDADARRAVELLRSEGAGRTCFVCRTQPAGTVAVGSPSNGNAAFPERLLRDRRVLGRLRERLSLDSGANGVLGNRIGDALLVDRLESALELHRRHPELDFLTTDGEVVYASGVVLADGKGVSDRGLLAHTRRTQEARAEHAEAAARAAELERQVLDSRTALQTIEAERDARRQALEDARRRHVELELRGQRAVAERERGARRLQVLGDELAALAADTGGLQHELDQRTSALFEAERVHRELDRDHAGRAQGVERVEQRRRELAEQVAALRAEAAALGQRRESVREEGARLGEALAELMQRIGGLRGSAAESRERATEATDKLGRLEEDLTRHLAEREECRRELSRLEQRIGDERRELEQREKTVARLRSELEAVRRTVREAEMALARAEADRTHLDDLCREELGILAAEAAGEAGEAALVDAEPEAIESEVSELREKLERIGPVNIMAIEEFSELEERYTFLSAQREDLEKSMASLRETIRKINRQSRERFSEAFEAIRRYYQDTFQSLFRGGRADLRLEEGEEDVLEAGIQILAQPPGKRLGSVQLLSGGEKAMSAIALLFAIFRYQPSPFCLLDEVDAPLDDVNVGRFTRMLKDYAEKTQFIIITHNKLSMEAADLLYGVTMEEAGVSKLMSLQLN